MGYGKFVQYYKSAVMLQARQEMIDIQTACYPNMKKDERARIWRQLKQSATQFIEKEIKDYREVLKNLALGLMRR